MVCSRTVQSGSLLIDSSTIDPAVSKDMAAIAETHGANFVDAPVSGGRYCKDVKWFLFSFFLILNNI